MTIINQLFLLGSSATLIYLFWLILSRLIIHSLAKIPGPRLAALTRWYECYFDIWLPAQYPWKIKQLHEIYGPIIRPVPDEVHINDPDFLDTIYALRGRSQRVSMGLMVDQSVGAAEDNQLHKMRRDALNPYFSQKAVLSMEHLIADKSNKVKGIFDRAVESGESLNISDMYFAFSNDLVRSFSFGSDNGLLHDLSEASRQRNDLARLLGGVKVNRHFPFIPGILGKVLPMLFGEKALPPAIRDLLHFKARAREDIEAVLADKTNEKKGQHSVFYELRDSLILPPEEKTAERLQDEATLLVMAGTESTAKSLGYGSFYLLYYPETLESLREEIRDARAANGTGRLSLSQLLALPYLNAVINETNRLTFGVTNRMLRYSPTETLTYTSTYGPHKGTTYTLPPGTVMSCITYCTHTNESLFPDPLVFDPERFLGHSEEVNKRKRCMMALGKGHRRCLGINVANAGMCLVLAAFAEFEMSLYETDLSDVAFRHDYQIAHPRLDSLGVRVRVEGKHKDAVEK